jgi:hypothetical protein
MGVMAVLWRSIVRQQLSMGKNLPLSRRWQATSRQGHAETADAKALVPKGLQA